MTDEQEILLALMGAAIRGERPGTMPADADWKALFREAYAQAVPLLFFDTIADMPDVPEAVYSKSFAMARRSTAHNLRAEDTQARLVSALKAGEHPYVILKGEASAVYYPRPELRHLGDVDILLQEGHGEAVAEKLKQQGYVHTCQEGAHHQTLHRDGEQIELHFEVAGIPGGEAGTAVREYLKTVLDERETVDRGNGTYCVPCPAHHGLILLLHMQHHMQSNGMGVRHIMDWACFVQKTAAEPFWEERLLPLLEKIGLKYFAAVFTKLAALYLGIVCPDWAADAEEMLCRELMEDLMAGGNFGCKDPERARSGNMLPDWTEESAPKNKVARLFLTLRGSVLRDRPDLAEKPVVRTLHMGWKALRYCVLYCAGKRPDLWKAAVYADARRSVYDRLRMFDPED